MDRVMGAYRSLVKIARFKNTSTPLFAYDFLAERHSISKIHPPWQQRECSVPHRLFSRWYSFFFYKESNSMFCWFDKHAVAVAMEGWSCKSPSSWNALPLLFGRVDVWGPAWSLRWCPHTNSAFIVSHGAHSVTCMCTNPSIKLV